MEIEKELNRILDVDSDVDLFCLHSFFYDLSQRLLQSFKDAWNCHPLWRDNHKSPIQL
jgi:folate-dependent phosphoribosylglycinamide formyltransferase PurN